MVEKLKHVKGNVCVVKGVRDTTPGMSLGKELQDHRDLGLGK